MKKPEEEVLYHQKKSDLVQKNYSRCSISELGTDFFGNFWSRKDNQKEIGIP